MVKMKLKKAAEVCPDNQTAFCLAAKQAFKGALKPFLISLTVETPLKKESDLRITGLERLGK